LASSLLVGVCVAIPAARIAPGNAVIDFPCPTSPKCLGRLLEANLSVFGFSCFLKKLDRKKSIRRGCGKRASQRFPGGARDCVTPVGNLLLVFHGLYMVEQPRREFSTMRVEPITVQSLYNHCTISVRWRAFLYREVLFFVPRSSVFCTEKFCFLYREVLLKTEFCTAFSTI